MVIGEKVKFNKHLLINEAGKIIYDKLGIRIFTNEKGEEQRSSIRIYPWIKERKDRVLHWRLRKLEIPEKSGVYIGSIYKKLDRSYKLTEETTPSLRRRRGIHLERIFRPDPFQEISAVSEPPRPSTWTTKNPNRLDNPNKLDELAIIAVSKTKRYVVDMKDIFEYNMSSNIKIL
jgi:hypothetical protein